MSLDPTYMPILNNADPAEVLATRQQDQHLFNPRWTLYGNTEQPAITSDIHSPVVSLQL